MTALSNLKPEQVQQLTDMLPEIIMALKGAVATYQYASMTTWEREYCKEDTEQAEEVLAKIEEITK